MATYTVDKIGYNNNEYVLQDSGALQLTGGSVTGPVTFSDNISVDTINSITVGSSPKFTDTTYSLSNALSSHKFTSTLTAGGSGSGTSTATIELAAGTGITLTDDATNKKITIASSVTNTDTKLQVAAVTSGTTYYPIVGTGTTAATRQYDTTGFIYKGTNGTTSAVGSSILTLGNSTASGTANNKQGQLVIYGSTAYAHTIQGAPTAARTLTLPNATGTIALTSDIPTVPDVSGKIDTAGTGLSKSGTTLNHSNSVTAGTAGTSSATSGSTLAVPYITYDAQGHITGSGTHTHTISGFATSDVNVTSTAVTAATANYLVGSTSSNTATGTLSKHASALIYTTADSATSGHTQLRLGNTTATSSAGGKEGQIRLYGTNATYYAVIVGGAQTANHTITLPDAQGTVALTSNIPSITLNGSSTTSPGFYAPTGAGTSGQYLKSSGTGAPTWANFPTIPSITLNGSSSTSPSFYAPTSAGTSGYYLKSSGSGAPTWTAFPTIPSITFNGSSTTSPTFYAPTGVGTSGNILKSSGTGAPTWSSLSSSDVTTALGYTPYNSTNPNGYTSNTGTVTGVKVNGTTINPTSGVVDIGTVAASDTQVTQNVISSDDTNSYPLLLSASTDGTTATTETALKGNTLTFIRNDNDASALNIGNGRVVLGRVHYYSDEDTPNQGTGFGIGTGDSSQSEIVCRTADGSLRLRHWSAAKGSDGSITTQFRDGIIDIAAGSSNPTIYMYSKTDKNTVSSYLRLRPTDLYINNGSAHQLNYVGIDKINNFADPYHVAITGSAVSLNNTNFNVMQSFTISDAGTYLVSVIGMFPAIASSALKIVRLTSNTSTDALSAACEATLPSTVTGNLNKVCFTAIVNLSATTYRIQMKTTSATNGSGYSAYSYVRLL